MTGSRRAERIAVMACACLLLAGAIWGGGFAAFNRMARLPRDPPPKADAIVVLTGGADRIETALRLLAEGQAPLMLVSGVGRGADIAELARRVPLSPDEAARVTTSVKLGHVTLGRQATTTVGNATETAVWARGNGVRSLIVVTAGYHMPRALIEIGRALPGVALHPVSVQPPALRGGMEFATVRMMANEYDKYLAVWLGLTRRAEAEGS